MTRTLVLLAVALLGGCGRDVTAPLAPVAPQVAGPCWITQKYTLASGSVVTLRAHADPCPSDAELKALGWTREP